MLFLVLALTFVFFLFVVVVDTATAIGAGVGIVTAGGVIVVRVVSSVHPRAMGSGAVHVMGHVAVLERAPDVV